MLTTKRKWVLCNFVFFTLMAFLACSVSPALAAPKILKYADHDPDAGPRGESLKIWFQEIEKESEGRIKIEAYFGGVLGRAPEALKLVMDGAVDIAMILPDYFPKQFIANNIYKTFPQGPKKWENISWVYSEIFKLPYFKEEFDRLGVKVLWAGAALPIALTSTYPVDSIDDLKGKKWRAASRWHLAYLENMGALPVSVPWADCYMALQTGTIDGLLADIDGIHMTKLDEAGPNIFTSPSIWYGSPFMHVINSKVWDSLSKEDQDAINRASETIKSKHFGKLFAAEFNKINEAQKKMGVKVNFWSETDVAKWSDPAFQTKLRGKWIKEAEGTGLVNAADIAKKVGKIIQEGIAKD